jgi:hypothetical protein
MCATTCLHEGWPVVHAADDVRGQDGVAEPVEVYLGSLRSATVKNAWTLRVQLCLTYADQPA